MSQKSGLADSPFFSPGPSTKEAANTQPAPSPEPSQKQAKLGSTSSSLPSVQAMKKVRTREPKSASMRATLTPRNQASMHASNQASMHALLPESRIETIRKAVKDVGKDSATYRFTPEEKKALLELGFSFKMQGYKTSENEVVRIAINIILEDQRLNGRASVLQKVLEALNK